MIPVIAAAAVCLGPVTVLYAYLGFPLLLSLLARRGRVGHEPRPARGAPLRVTVVIPAHNEEAAIGARIENILASDYPPALLQTIVVSDASTDRTDQVAGSFAARGVHLIIQSARRGKTAGLNRAIESASGEIVVFTDANAAFPPDTIARLVDRFSDPHVGLVTGYTKYAIGRNGEVAEATNVYTRLERRIKQGESAFGYCVGADGAIFAMRRAFYRPLRDDDINDFALPLSVIDQGYESILADDVFCAESAGESVESEFRRQSRITNRSLRALWRRKHLLDPIRYPLLSFFLFSHKVLRFLVPWFLIASVAGLGMLPARDSRGVALAVLAAGGALLVAAAARARSAAGVAAWRGLRMAGLFAAINVAMLHGWWKFLTGNEEVTWQHDRALSKR